jgi:hypothetical protein
VIEPIAILIALVGLLFVGFAFTTINLVKGATRLLGLGLIVLFAIVIANRPWPQLTGDLTNPNPVTDPNLRSNVDNVTRQVSNFADALDQFVYGISPNQSANQSANQGTNQQQTTDRTIGTTTTSTARERQVNAPSSPSPAPGSSTTPVTQQPSPRPTTPLPARTPSPVPPATSVPARRPIPGLW